MLSTILILCHTKCEFLWFCVIINCWNSLQDCFPVETCTDLGITVGREIIRELCCFLNTPRNSSEIWIDYVHIWELIVLAHDIPFQNSQKWGIRTYSKHSGTMLLLTRLSGRIYTSFQAIEDLCGLDALNIHFRNFQFIQNRLLLTSFL